jgi:3-keto-5-aminohexanoate cleavage enzyme
MVPTKDMNANVPISVNEIVDDTLAACEEGITLVHLHARDETGNATYKKEIYKDIIEQIKVYAPELVICLSLSGRNFNVFEKRSEAIELMPDMASLTLSSLNFAKQASVNDPDMITALLNKMQQFGVHPELEIFDLGMINYADYLIEKNLITSPLYYNIIFGNVAGMQANATSIAAVLSMLPRGAYWALGGIGQQQMIANTMAIALGGGVRIGLEDNLYFDHKKTLATNIQLIKRVKEIASIHERNIMSSTIFGSMGFYNKNRNS